MGPDDEANALNYYNLMRKSKSRGDVVKRAGDSTQKAVLSDGPSIGERQQNNFQVRKRIKTGYRRPQL